MMRRFRAVPEESRWKVSNGTATFLSGGMASNAFWIGSFPFDTIKKCVVPGVVVLTPRSTLTSLLVPHRAAA